MPSLIAESVHAQFLHFGYRWRLEDGSTFSPTEEDIDKVLDRAKELLYDEPVPSQLEVGRLLIRRSTDHNFDVYLHLGDIND